MQLSYHATVRRLEHRISVDDVLLTVAAPEQTYGCPAPVYGTHRRMYQRGQVAVVVDEKTRTVVTVLPRTTAQWTHRPA